MSPNQKATPWIRPKTASQNRRLRNSLPRAPSDRSPPIRKIEAPNSMENRVRILSWKKTCMICQACAASASNPVCRGGLDTTAQGQAKVMALTARIPSTASPRTMSRLNNRSPLATGASLVSGAGAPASLISAAAMTFPPIWRAPAWRKGGRSETEFCVTGGARGGQAWSRSPIRPSRSRTSGWGLNAMKAAHRPAHRA